MVVVVVMGEKVFTNYYEYEKVKKESLIVTVFDS